MARQAAPEPELSEHSERSERAERVERVERADRSERAERAERPKRRSVSKSLTLFYTVSLLCLLLILYFFLYLFTNRITTSASQPLLEKAVRETVNAMVFEENTILIDEDIDLFYDGVSLILYDSSGEVILGGLPNSFPAEITLVNDRHRLIESEINWNVYDLFVQYKGTGLWVRGMYSLSSANQIASNLTTALAISYPILIALVILAGYFITKRTLKPLEDLSAKVKEIGSGSDLRTRLPAAPTGKTNEITLLSENFNAMLDRLQNSFLKEQQFTSDASHELRTPVAAILAQAESGLIPGTTTEEKNHSLERIRGQIQNMDTLINQLLELTRGDRGTADVAFGRLNFSELTEMVCESLQESAADRRIILQSRLDEAVFVRADEVLLMRAVINLVNNAIQYGREGGFVTLDLRRDGPLALLSVTDNGIGIAEADLPHIFDRFYRVGRDRGQSGTYSSGLGLSMVKWIAEVHEGSIEVNSTPNAGSQFLLRLPLAED